MKCNHDTVIRMDENDTTEWVCSDCMLEMFIPVRQIRSRVEEAAQERLDMAAAVTSAMLWDFHTRAIETYGPTMALNFPTPAQDGESQFEHTVDTCPQHEFNGGQCVHCGTSQFLGEETL